MNDGSFAKDRKTIPIRSIVDTGTTLLVGPEDRVRWYHNQTPKSRKYRMTWVVPCKSQSKLAAVIEGKVFTVPHEDLAREYIGFGLCFSAMQTSSADYLILEDVFLNSYVVFDQAEKRVGFASLKTEAKKVTTAADTEDEDTASSRVQEGLQ